MAKKRTGGRSFTAENEGEVLRLVETRNETVGQMAEELDLVESSVRAWVKQAAIDEERSPTGALTSSNTVPQGSCSNL